MGSIMRLGLLLCFAWLELASGAKILAFFGMPATSHHIALQPVLRELANRGHTVDFYSAIPMKNPPKTLRHFELPDTINDPDKKVDFRALGKAPTPLISFFMHKIGEEATEGFSESQVFKDLLNSNEKYDLVIGEFLFINEDATALIHKFKAPGVCMMPMGDLTWVNELSGLPDNPAYMIDFKSLYTDNMGFFQRLHNAYTTTATNVVNYLSLTFTRQWTMDRVYRYPGWESRPRLPLLASDFALILLNSHHSVGYSFPKAPHVKEVPGTNIQPNKPLPQDLQDFMDSATDGVIYFSLGSIVDMSELMENGIFEAIHTVFKGLKQKVLWKFKDEKTIPKISTPNIRFSTWFPQQDILGLAATHTYEKTMRTPPLRPPIAMGEEKKKHGLSTDALVFLDPSEPEDNFFYNLLPNMPDESLGRLFITHGGLMSSIEAVNYGVPLIGIPVFGDQPKNIVRITSAGYGIGLDYENLTETSVSWAINEVLGNPSYKKEVLRRQALFKDRPMSPVQEAVYWVEYVLKHGNVLQPESARMPFYKLYLLDVIGFLAGCLLLALWTLKKALGIVCSLCGGKSKKSVTSSKKKQ